MKTLVILESPGKVKKIQSFLGPDYVVKASVGHIRDLEKSNKAIDKSTFDVNYIISPEKKDVVKELKDLYKKCDDVILMTDPDREGNNIAWHICEVLGIKPEKAKRATTTEITKDGVTKAIKNVGKLDMNSVEAGTARRILDRLVGFDLSPLLWAKIQKGLSAGRVQSVAVRIIVEREREITSFDAASDFKVVGFFEIKDKKNKLHTVKAILNKRFKNKDEAQKFLEKAIGSSYKVKSIETKPGKKSASAPFTTSTIQQDASRKFGFSVDKTMQVAQKLYEGGHITYMRTDSVNLSEEAINEAKKHITQEFGAKYSNPKQYKGKSANAQEAHEAIRPTHFENPTISGTDDEQKLYELIYKRTLASQMSDALLDKTTVTIESNKYKEEFVAKGEVITFDGFLKLYMESVEESEDEEENGSLPEMTKGQEAENTEIQANELFNKPAPRYTEASLVKQLEELGIGRPSTYATIIKTVQDRGYVEKKNLPAKKRDIFSLKLKNGKIDETIKTENFGAEKNKFFPTNTGMVVTDFLTENFKDVLDYKFTATVEEEFDKISKGELQWKTMISNFYSPFSKKISSVKNDKSNSSGKELGVDPKSKKKIFARIARFGPVIQLGEEKGDIKYVKLPEDKSIDTITLQEALDLLKWPRNLGEYKKLSVEVNSGKFGPYVKHDGKFYSITAIEPDKITLEEAIEIIKIKESGGGSGSSNVINEFGDLRVLNGQYGPYINNKKTKKNFKIPSHYDANTLTKDQCLEIIGEAKEKKPYTAAKKGAKKRG